MMQKRIEENMLLFCLRELLPHFSGREIAEKLKKTGYSENQIKEAIEFLKREKPDLSDLSIISQGNCLLEKISPSAEKLDKLKENVLKNKPDEIYLEEFLKNKLFVIGFDPDINLIPILLDSLEEKDPQIAGGASFLLEKIGSIKILDKLISALEKIKKENEKNPGVWHDDGCYEPTDSELVESIVGNSIISLSLKSRLSRDEKIEFKKTIFQASDFNRINWKLKNIKFDLKNKKEAENNILKQ